MNIKFWLLRKRIKTNYFKICIDSTQQQKKQKRL